ncbi:phosphoribosyl 1,2-cyclic phosphodiesterase [Thiogranum longum]|uniref:Phosphoribosyl 1,2-cyclic phosphodiesterase n=1 Tax=Thiogranum longum TaxID=1537524 RepID=A0A4R1H867_9GAMM|nr:MBL fold metallo-hydrolase [Thiogranum longum]TCK17418.1 phosphoribosyl 1,2-cyclic phosphodiesterase [Thiogranum longum]
MRFASLGSGSHGNATLVEVRATCLMIDCGFSCKETEKRLQQLGISPDSIDAILVTHEHSDHISGVARYSRRHGTPVWMTSGTEAMHQGGEVAELNIFNSHQSFSIGDIEIQPFPVPHDAREPCQFVFSDGQYRLGLLTDTGSITRHMVEALEGLDALILEFNHDPDMLADGPYPLGLKARVSGDFGHLSNAQAADLLGRLDLGRLKQLVAAHLSEKNNHPELAREHVENALGGHNVDIYIADQLVGIPWKNLIQNRLLPN